jgi:hypothetical protein
MTLYRLDEPHECRVEVVSHRPDRVAKFQGGGASLPRFSSIAFCSIRSNSRGAEPTLLLKGARVD